MHGASKRLTGLAHAPMAFVELIQIDKCRRGGGTFIERDGRELGIFWLDAPERVIVIDNTCPHAGGNLSAGEISGSIVTCPWHHWQFDLNTGACTHSARVRVRRFQAEVRDGVIWVDLPAMIRGPK